MDIGGTKCAMTLGAVEDGGVTVEQKQQFPTEGKTPQEVLSLFSDFIEQSLQSYQILGIGISCGGPLDSRRGIIMKPPSLPLWDNIEIVAYFQDKYNIPTYLQNDANACAVAEWKFGAGKGARNVVFLTFGTGLGAGLILDGKLYVGENDNAGEIGHVRLTERGPVGYRKAGSCEGYCSGSGIRRLAAIMATKEERAGRLPALAREYGKENLTAKLLAERARQGDAFAQKVFKKSGEMLGKTLSILIDILNPQKIILGGVYMRSEDLLYPHAIRVIKRESLRYANSVCQILPAGLGETIGDVAALSVAQGGF